MELPCIWVLRRGPWMGGKQPAVPAVTHELTGPSLPGLVYTARAEEGDMPCDARAWRVMFACVYIHVGTDESGMAVGGEGEWKRGGLRPVGVRAMDTIPGERKVEG